MTSAIEIKDFKITRKYLIKSQLFRELQQNILIYYREEKAFHDKLLLVGAYESGLVPNFLFEECQHCMVNPKVIELKIVTDLLIDYYNPEPASLAEGNFSVNALPNPDTFLN